MQLNKMWILLLLAFSLLFSTSVRSFEFHRGWEILNRPPWGGDFFYPIYDIEENIQLLKGDKQFLKSVFYENEFIEYDTLVFNCDRILKMLGYDSVYVMNYSCSKKRPGHEYFLILSDLRNGKKWFLNDLGIEDFNDFIIGRSKEHAWDYDNISSIFIVLKNLDLPLFFCESSGCLGIMLLDFDLYPLSPRNSLIQESFNNFIQNSGIDFEDLIIKSNDSSIIVNKYVYIVPHQDFYRYIFTYKNILIDYKKELLWKFKDQE